MFTHDNRLAEAVRQLRLPATMPGGDQAARFRGGGARVPGPGGSRHFATPVRLPLTARCHPRSQRE